MQRKGAGRLQSGPMLCCVPADTCGLLISLSHGGGEAAFLAKSLSVWKAWENVCSGQGDVRKK